MSRADRIMSRKDKSTHMGRARGYRSSGISPTRYQILENIKFANKIEKVMDFIKRAIPDVSSPFTKMFRRKI